MSNSNYYLHNSYTLKRDRHPINWVQSIIQSSIQSNWLDSSTLLTFSRYFYIPQSLQDIRNDFSINAQSFMEIDLPNLLFDLEENYELAFCSTVNSFGQTLHLPMIDFSLKSHPSHLLYIMQEVCKYWSISFNLYSSGRSYHAYGNRLLTHDDWVKFMASLLLINKPSGLKLIDERWIGHRILGGYAALRWSKNTSHYKKFPTFCGYITSDYFELMTNQNLFITSSQQTS